MELTEYAAKCFEPITEEIYDQVQWISLKVKEYMDGQHTGVHSHVVKAVTYDCLMHYFEACVHDDARLTLEERPDVIDIREWAENSYCDLQED